MDGYVTAKTTAELLAVSVKMIYKLVERGELEALKVGRCVRIPIASVEAFIARCRTVATVPPVYSGSQSPLPKRRSQRQGDASGFVFLPPQRP